MNISRKIKSLVGVGLLTAFFFGITQSAEALTYPPDAITTNQTNATFNSNVIVAGQPNTAPPLASDPGVTFTAVEIGGSLKDGDVVRLHFVRWDGTETTQDITSLPYTAYPGSYGFYYQLITSSTSGYRQTYFVSATNSDGVTTYWNEPSPPPSDGSTGTTTIINLNADYSGVVSAIQEVKSQLNSFSSDVHSQFQSVIGQLGDLNDYFTTPRVPDSFNVQPLPEVTFDPTPPDISEPYQQPYTYDRPEPSMPAPVDSPEPLPYAPDPQVMEHDQPLQIDQPRQKDTPVARDNPLVPDSPLPLDPVIKQDPLTPDPVIKQDPIARDAPITPDSPLARETPLTPETPFEKEPAIQRDPPLTPEPPLIPGG